MPEFSDGSGDIEGGADIRYIQAMLGHARQDTAQIYTHLSIRMRRGARRKVYTYVHAKKGETAEQVRKAIIEGKWRDVDLTEYEKPSVQK